MLVLWDHLRHHARGGSRVQVGLDIEVVELRAVPDCLHGWQCEPALGSRASLDSVPGGPIALGLGKKVRSSNWER